MIADFVARDAWAERDDFTRYIVGKDERWLGAPEGVVAEFLIMGIYWILLNDVLGVGTVEGKVRPAEVTFTTISPSPGVGMGRVTLTSGLPVSTTWRAFWEVIL